MKTVKTTPFWISNINPITGHPDSKPRSSSAIDATATRVNIEGNSYKNLQI